MQGVILRDLAVHSSLFGPLRQTIQHGLRAYVVSDLSFNRHVHMRAASTPGFRTQIDGGEGRAPPLWFQLQDPVLASAVR